MTWKRSQSWNSQSCKLLSRFARVKQLCCERSVATGGPRISSLMEARLNRDRELGEKTLAVLERIERMMQQQFNRIEEKIMATLPGLTALTQAVTDLTDAVSAAATAISAAAAELAQNEDPAVQNAAAQIEAQVTALKTATAALTPAPPAAS